MEGQDIRRIRKEIGTKVFPFGISNDLRQIGLQLLFSGAPGEVCVRLAESELCERLHHGGPGKSFGQEYYVGIRRLRLPDQPFPKREWLGVRIVDAEDSHALVDPKQHDV